MYIDIYYYILIYILVYCNILLYIDIHFEFQNKKLIHFYAYSNLKHKRCYAKTVTTKDKDNAYDTKPVTRFNDYRYVCACILFISTNY